MDHTKITWADATFNPVTGCYHNCEYCYARVMAKRFGGTYFLRQGENGEIEDWFLMPDDDDIHVLNEPIMHGHWEHEVAAPYPYYFEPTLYRYRMDIPTKWKKPRNIFVCSMADLFGEWIPVGWQKEVFAACRKAPQHNYMFLTKNPGKYLELQANGVLPEESNMWYGTTVTKPDDPFPYYWEESRGENEKAHLFLSIEPILSDFGKGGDGVLNDVEWVIIGAETGRRKDKVIPEKSWIDNLVAQCREYNIPVFMKESLRALYGDDLLTEFPKGLLHG